MIELFQEPFLCVHVCLCIYRCVLECTCFCTCMGIWVCTCIYTCVYVCVCICICVYACMLHLYLCVPVFICAFVPVCIHICICLLLVYFSLGVITTIWPRTTWKEKGLFGVQIIVHCQGRLSQELKRRTQRNVANWLISSVFLNNISLIFF